MSATAAMTDFHPAESRGFFTRLSDWFIQTSERAYERSDAARCAARAKRLEQLSDAELDRIGLKRAEIHPFAFRDLAIHT